PLPPRSAQRSRDYRSRALLARVEMGHIRIGSAGEAASGRAGPVHGQAIGHMLPATGSGGTLLNLSECARESAGLIGAYKLLACDHSRMDLRILGDIARTPKMKNPSGGKIGSRVLDAFR